MDRVAVNNRKPAGEIGAGDRTLVPRGAGGFRVCRQTTGPVPSKQTEVVPGPRPQTWVVEAVAIRADVTATDDCPLAMIDEAERRWGPGSTCSYTKRIDPI